MNNSLRRNMNYKTAESGEQPQHLLTNSASQLANSQLAKPQLTPDPNPTTPNSMHRVITDYASIGSSKRIIAKQAVDTPLHAAQGNNIMSQEKIS